MKPHPLAWAYLRAAAEAHHARGHTVPTGMPSPAMQMHRARDAWQRAGCPLEEAPADPEAFRLAAPGKVLVLPMDGPAFYGFEVLTEAEAMAELLAARPIDYDARNERRRLTMNDDAVEVPGASGIIHDDGDEDSCDF